MIIVFQRLFPISLISILLLTSTQAQITEGRGVWCCAFGPYESPEAVRQMVADADAAGCNAIFFQARLRGDAMYQPNRHSSLFPNSEPLREPALRFDPLEVCIEEAHARDIEVHAYVTYSLVASPRRPTEPNHVLNQHPEWVTGRLMEDGTVRQAVEHEEGSWMDPGIPAFNDYTFNVYMDIAMNYDIDGLHLDRVRYPQGEGWPPASRYGYHPIAVRRFNAEMGRSGLPEPGDPVWVEWRKDQISDFLERLSETLWAAKPWVRISVTPVTMDGLRGSQDSCLQDWPEWVERGVVDIVVPQVYSNSTRGNGRAVVERGTQYLEEMARLNAIPGRRGPAQMWIGLRAWSNEANGPSVAEKIEALRSLPHPPDGYLLFRYGTARQLGIMDHMGRTVWSTPARPPLILSHDLQEALRPGHRSALGLAPWR